MIACSGGQPEPQLSEAAPDDTAQSFYTQLAALQSQYGFTAMDKVELTAGADFASMEDGSLQLLTDLALNDRGGLLLQFSFTQSLDSADNALFFVIQPAGTKQAFISRDGLQVLQDGQPLASYAFSETPDWQPGTPLRDVPASYSRGRVGSIRLGFCAARMDCPVESRRGYSG